MIGFYYSCFERITRSGNLIIFWIILFFLTGCSAPEDSPFFDLPGYHPEHKTNYSSVHLVGKIASSYDWIDPSWSYEDAEKTLMKNSSDYVWEKTLYIDIPSSGIEFKFGVDGFDNDGGWITHNGNSGFGDSGTWGRASEGYNLTGNNIKPSNYPQEITIKQNQSYRFTFNDSTLEYSIELQEKLGKITGNIEFSDDPQQLPEVSVKAHLGASDTVYAETSSSALNGFFELSSLENGTYMLDFRCSSYRDTSMTGIVVSQGDSVHAGSMELQKIKTDKAKPDKPFFTVSVDGIIDNGWIPVYENTHTSGWGQENELKNFYCAWDSVNLYLAVEGVFDSSYNCINVYLDRDLGFETGVSFFGDISATLEKARNLQKNIYCPQGYGAEFGFTIWGLKYAAGLLNIENPLSPEEISGINYAVEKNVVEFAVPWNTVYELGEGLVPPFIRLGVIVIIGGGSADSYCDDTIPQEDNPSNFKESVVIPVDTDGK